MTQIKKGSFSNTFRFFIHLNTSFIYRLQIRLNTPHHHLLLKIIYSKNSQIKFYGKMKLQTHFTLSNNEKNVHFMSYYASIFGRHRKSVSESFFLLSCRKFLLFIRFSWTAKYIFFLLLRHYYFYKPKNKWLTFFSVNSHTQLHLSDFVSRRHRRCFV